MSNKKPLKTIAGAPERPLVIGDVEIPCYVLEDETRVLSQRGLQSSIGLGTGGGTSGAPKLMEVIESFERKGLDINGLAAHLSSPIEFQPPAGGRTAYGYPATVLVDICDVIIEAHKLGITRRAALVDRAMTLIRGLATVGVIALVDEATGYQRIREERSLATILEKFIAKELQPWTKTFPYEFYKEIFYLRGWPMPDGVKRPSVIGKYTNDIVYERLAYGVLQELQRLNPKLPSGNRRHRHHQWFSTDLGHPKLKEHISAVTALMRASPNWTTFMKNLNRAFPKPEQQLEFRLPTKEDDED